MSEAHKLAEKDYLSGLKYKEIAEKYGVTLNTVKSWKQRHGWSREKGAPVDKSVHTNKGGAPRGNRNALGNKGGAAPKRNGNAIKHGLFRKFLPDDPETREIYDSAGQMSPLDLLWEQIQIKFTAIIRAQRIMFVRDRDDQTKVVKKDLDIGTEYEIQHAWDKQAAFLTAQARAMTALTSMIRQYEEMLRAAPPDELREERLLQIEKLRVEIAKTKGADGGETEDDGFLEALKGKAAEVWADEGAT
ncbi:phage terminase small subunit [Paenibacillus flagellatus]|uniref:RNA polymerase sigma factor 70 region 4 type 2 domain-containing protein n=1 Tax=Paenibacillus flagellatus TaxID=2211139 RepID=A0A2V5KF89_9BACL|nr:phage terminase small subunit [Paenibacillus flagellatus]PYI57034.1 hypothetical protein DLM86_00875 [Paenibacillus flagellatus]